MALKQFGLDLYVMYIYFKLIFKINWKYFSNLVLYMAKKQFGLDLYIRHI